MQFYVNTEQICALRWRNKSGDVRWISQLLSTNGRHKFFSKCIGLHVCMHLFVISLLAKPSSLREKPWWKFWDNKNAAAHILFDLCQNQTLKDISENSHFSYVSDKEILTHECYWVDQSTLQPNAPFCTQMGAVDFCETDDQIINQREVHMQTRCNLMQFLYSTELWMLASQMSVSCQTNGCSSACLQSLRVSICENDSSNARSVYDYVHSEENSQSKFIKRMKKCGCACYMRNCFGFTVCAATISAPVFDQKWPHVYRGQLRALWTNSDLSSPWQKVEGLSRSGSWRGSSMRCCPVTCCAATTRHAT